MPATVGVDVGGTFTDVVVFDGETIAGHKLSTTADQSVAVAAALDAAGVDARTMFLHGTTAGTNALLEGRGAKCALVTSRGFEDLIEIGRQARPSLYDSFVDRAPVLVPRPLRIGYDGDFEALRPLLADAAPEVIAVALVRSYSDPTEELDLASRLASELDLPVSAGAVVSPAFREYERIATTVLNAFLTPEVAGYLERLDRTIAAGQRLVMTSSGGLLPFASAGKYAGRLVLSGPAAGVVAASALGRAKGHESVISFDMGGTSTDVCRIDGRARRASRQVAGGWVNRVPSLPVRTIGAGGGSLAWVDQGGALRVGPRSAGADPGPAAYGLGGGQATVTDANVILGRIPAGAALGGSVALDVGAAREAVAEIASSLSLDVGTLAAGIIDVVDTHMERALRTVTVEEGVDPRDSVLVGFGGAGGLHASRLARRVGIRTTLIPPLSGVFSALGLLLASPSSDAERTVMLEEGSSRLTSTARGVADEAAGIFARDHGSIGGDPAGTAEVRYVGQSHELAVELTPDWAELRTEFEAAHRSRFGFVRSGEPIELVNVRALVSGTPPISWDDVPGLPAAEKPQPTRAASDVPVWERGDLPPGFETMGPAIVVERDSAVWLEPGDRLSVHDDGTLEIVW
ncbi:MAG: hydantoinase/oxoprolinase family protein [Acidimicrobiia bacterium]